MVKTNGVALVAVVVNPNNDALAAGAEVAPVPPFANGKAVPE